MTQGTRSTLLTFLVGVSAAPLSAQLIVEPTGIGGSYTTIQAAIDAALPGQVIVVLSGVYDGPVVINKAVTLVGQGMPEIRHEYVLNIGWRCVELAGPGNGKVVIAGFKIGSEVQPNLTQVASGISEPGISGGGFTELDIVRCDVRGPTFTIASDGVAAGDSAVLVGIPNVVVANSLLTASPILTDQPWWTAWGPPAPSVVVSGVLTLIDSTVIGAKGTEFYYSTAFGGIWPPPPLPCPCPELGSFSSGGAGVKAGSAYAVNSNVIGGAGGTISIWYPLTGTYVPFGNQPDGPAWLLNAPLHIIPDVGLHAPEPARLGQPWSLTFPVEWSVSNIYLSIDMSIPYSIGSSFAFMNQIASAAPLSFGMTSLTFSWPWDPAWLGLETVWQLYDPALGASRPVFDILLP